jgi:hypothetical protein
MTVTTGVAIYGALVGTASLAWNMYWEVTNRGRLRVQVDVGNVHLGGPTFGVAAEPIQRGQLMFAVTNVGRRPIFLVQIGGGYDNGDYFIMPTPADEGRLPVRLEPGQSFNDASMGAAVLDNPELRFLGAWDGENRIYKLSDRQFMQLTTRRRASRARQSKAAGVCPESGGNGQRSHLEPRHVLTTNSDRQGPKGAVSAPCRPLILSVVVGG